MNQSVIITGGAKRVGAATALYFAKHGYDIALHYNRSKKEAAALQKKIHKIGARCELFHCDLSDVKKIPALMKAVQKKMPHCSVLVNNASVFERMEFLKTNEKLFDRQFDINFKAPFFLTQSFANTFKKGSVVNIVDTDITKTHGSHFAYLLSKKALADFTQMAARALGPNMRVNGVCPGCMLPSSANDKDYEEKMRDIVPLKAHPTLGELAEAVRWLSEQKTITGQIIFVDGGKHVL